MNSKNQIIQLKEGISVTPSLGNLTIWQTYAWAQFWFEDAVHEGRRQATGDQVRHARRREILFAVCFAETYLYEWVRDDVLKRDYDSLNDFFPPGNRGLGETWKDVQKKLRAQGLILRRSKTGDGQSEEWNRLLDFRNGLMHAGASRPKSASRPSEPGPVPDLDALDALPAFWAVDIVCEQVQRLHDAVGTSLPTWLSR